MSNKKKLTSENLNNVLLSCYNSADDKLHIGLTKEIKKMMSGKDSLILRNSPDAGYKLTAVCSHYLSSLTYKHMLKDLSVEDDNIALFLIKSLELLHTTPMLVNKGGKGEAALNLISKYISETSEKNYENILSHAQEMVLELMKESEAVSVKSGADGKVDEDQEEENVGEKQELDVDSVIEMDDSSVVEKGFEDLILSPVFNTSDLESFYSTQESNELNIFIMMNIKSAVKKIENSADVNQLNILKDGLVEIFSSNIEFFEGILKQLEEDFGVSRNIKRNLNMILESLDLNDEEYNVLEYLFILQWCKNPLINYYFKNNDDLFAFIDNLLNLNSGSTFNIVKKINKVGGLFKYFDKIDGANLLDLYNAKFIEYFANYYAEKEDLFSKILDNNYELNKIETNLTKENFSHMGQDFTNLVHAIKSSKQTRILIVGKSGVGKSELINTALKESGVQSILMDDSDGNLDSYSVVNFRSNSKFIGKPVLVVDPMDSIVDSQEILNSLFMGNNTRKSPSNEIWVTNDASKLNPSIVNNFDLVIDVPTLPLINRKKLAMDLFNDEFLADKISKCCTTPLEIKRLHDWSITSGQNTWEDLSIKAFSSQQATLKAGASSHELPLTLYQPSENTKGFDSVVGNKYVVDEIKKAVMTFRNPEKFKKLGATPPKGLLLTGLPGTGKTYVVRAMAHESGVPLLVASSSALATQPALITSVFAEARRQAPCILFLDELDAIGASAENLNGASADPMRQAILNRLLVEINGIEDLEGVMIVGATHRPHVLDPALVRSGRLGWGIKFVLPNLEEREEIWRYYAKDVLVSEDVDWRRVARLSSGLSPADICEAVKVAALNAAMDDQEAITTKYLTKAIDIAVFGDKGPDRKVHENDIYETAIHEAGHALLCYAYEKEIDHISVRPSGSFLGYVKHLPDEEKMSTDINDCKESVSVSFGGLVAEEICLGKRCVGAISDLENIRVTVNNLFRSEGLSKSAPAGISQFSVTPQLLNEIEKEEKEFINEVKQLTINILGNSSPVLKKLAKRLVNDREISADEFYEFMQEEGLTPENLRKFADVSFSNNNVEKLKEVDLNKEVEGLSKVIPDVSVAARKKNKR